MLVVEETELSSTMMIAEKLLRCGVVIFSITNLNSKKKPKVKFCAGSNPDGNSFVKTSFSGHLRLAVSDEFLR